MNCQMTISRHTQDILWSLLLFKLTTVVRIQLETPDGINSGARAVAMTSSDGTIFVGEANLIESRNACVYSRRLRSSWTHC